MILLLQNWFAQVEQTMKVFFNAPANIQPKLECTVDCNASIEHLPTNILEHICTYLTDESVVAMTQVSTSLYNQLGHPNAEVWVMLLHRNNWPCDHKSIEDNVIIGSYRWQFLQHYSIMRDMKALQRGYDYFLQRKRDINIIDNTDLAMYISGQKAKIDDDRCIIVGVWSPRHVLVAFKADCTLRLYEATRTSTTHGAGNSGVVPNDKICHELFCHRIDPCQHMTDMRCEIQEIVLDDTYITTLCNVHTTVGETVLVHQELFVLLRQDFVQEDSCGVVNDSGNMKSDANQKMPRVFNLDKAVNTHMLNEVDCPIRLRNLNAEELVVHLLVVGISMVSCGSGLILINGIMVLRPGTSELVGSRIFLCCLRTNKIVWSNECRELQDTSNGDYHMKHIGSLSSYYQSNISTKSNTSTGNYNFVVASRSPNVNNIMVGVVEPSGTVSVRNVVNARQKPVAYDALWERDVEDDNKRQILMTLNDIVTADVWKKYNSSHDRVSASTLVAFYPMNHSLQSSEETTFDYFEISGDLVVQQLSHVQDTYLIVTCLEITDENFFMQVDTLSNAKRGVSVVIHLPSRKEIGRIDWKSASEGTYNLFFLPKLTTIGHGTFGFEIYKEVIAITGNDIRHHVVSTVEERENPKPWCW